MNDDYQYKSRSVPKVDQEPLGFGRVLPFGFNSFVPSNGESGSSVGGSGKPTGAVVAANANNGSGGGGGGGGGSLPDGTEGAFLRYNGSDWVAIGPSLTKGILTNNAASHEWISGVTQGDMIYYNGDGWIRLSLPQSGTHFLCAVNGNLQYIDLTPPPSGIHVLSAADGSISYIEAESCD
jgi:hypothetical protein